MVDETKYSEMSKVIHREEEGSKTPYEADHTSDSSDGSHCHDKSNTRELDKKARNKLIIASIFCVIFLTAEAAGGILAGSLAIVSDAAHLLTDLASFLVSLLALYLGTRPATKKLSFGWYRAEILGALLSILVLWILTGILCYSAVERVISENYEINATIMLITASVGVAFNFFLGCILHQHSHGAGGSHSHGFGSSSHSHDSKSPSHDAESQSDEPESHSHNGAKTYGSIADDGGTKPTARKSEKNINVTAAFIHVLGDFVQSIGVLVAAFIIYFKPSYKIADPICTFLFSFLVFLTTMTVLRDVILVLMEGTPKHVNFSDVRKTFYGIKGVKDIHNLRVWSLTLNRIALSVHIAIEKDQNPLEIIKEASLLIKTNHGIDDTTIQIEEYVNEMLDCSKCQDLKD